MTIYKPVTATTAFNTNATIETEVFDLKQTIIGYSNARIAMAVAQFANHLGGTLLIGADEHQGRIGTFLPMSAQDETNARKQVSDAVEQCCVPQPLFSCVPIPHGLGFLVAVNVEPSLAGCIGVRVKSDKTATGFGGTSFVFPVRVGTGGGFITPENMHNHMLPALRRTIILLQSLTIGDEIYIAGDGFGTGVRGQVSDRVQVEEHANRVGVWIDNNRYIIPLPSLRLIYRGERDVWMLDVKHG